ncbi:MAG: septal ring lytic transglycosylase RlpA family protein [Thermodesulfobacteriota bacterium]
MKRGNHPHFFILGMIGSMLLMNLLPACASRRPVVMERPLPPLEPRIAKKEIPGGAQYGIASWYGKDFHGKPTSSGEIYDMYQLTCAHNTLPLGTMVMVTHLENGKSVELKVNDRGPFVKDRIIDISYAAAQIIGMYEKGTAYVKVEPIGPVIESPQRFTLQVGSFVEESNAQALAEQLRKNYDAVHVTTMETLSQKYYRVRVGQFETKEEALSIAEKLSQMGFKVLVTSR